jgi:hypothetical protein
VKLLCLFFICGNLSANEEVAEYIAQEASADLFYHIMLRNQGKKAKMPYSRVLPSYAITAHQIFLAISSPLSTSITVY